MYQEQYYKYGGSVNIDDPNVYSNMINIPKQQETQQITTNTTEETSKETTNYDRIFWTIIIIVMFFLIITFWKFFSGIDLNLMIN